MARSHWTEAADEIRARFARNPRLLMASDFDGTLSPIVDCPADAVFADTVVRRLREINAMDARCGLAIVSGREIRDLGKRVLPVAPSAILVGNHGLEIQSQGWGWRHPAIVDVGRQLKQMACLLEDRLRLIPGIGIEDKGLSLTIHYRRIPANRTPVLRRFMAEMEIPVGFAIHPGKKVFEIRPEVDWDKGKALRLIAERLELPDDAVVFLGDDVTDEDAFREFSQGGYTVHVGSSGKPSAARFNASDPDDVADFLGMMVEAARLPCGP